MKTQGNKRGFTLIELLVVITIIGILAVGWVSVFTTQLQWARDSTRINDMKLMETAIHQYFSDQTEYPPAKGFSGAVKEFMSKELKDTKSWKSLCWQATTPPTDMKCGWYYVRTNDSFWLTNSAFKIGIAFEKRVNMEKKWTGTYDGWNNDSYFEAFAWAWANELTIWSGGTVPDADATATYSSGTWTNNASANIY